MRKDKSLAHVGNRSYEGQEVIHIEAQNGRAGAPSSLQDSHSQSVKGGPGIETRKAVTVTAKN